MQFVATDRQKRRLEDEAEPNRQKIKTPQPKGPRTQCDDRAHNRREKTNCRNNEKLSIHRMCYPKIATYPWQSGVCLHARKEIPKTVFDYEHQTPYSRNRRRLCGSLGD